MTIPLLALAFLNPTLLGGLGLAAIPIIIHLLSRRQFRRVDWGAMRFLLEAEKQNRRRVRFEQWLLVALRCLALALLALVIARPFVQPGIVASLLGGGGQAHRIVLLDDSASMQYRGSSAAEFDQLKATTQRLVDWFRRAAPQDILTIYATSRPDEPLLSKTRLNDPALDDFMARLRSLAPSALRAEPRRAIEYIAAALRDSPAQDADIFIVSDFQRTDWTPVADAAASVFAPLRETAGAGNARRVARTRVMLVATSEPPRPNVAMLDVALARPQTLAGLPAVVRARVANYTPRALHDLTLQIEIGGAPLPAVPIETLDAGRDRVVSLEVSFPEPGFHELTVGFGPRDPFPLDDFRRLTVDVKESISVLIVNGQPSSNPNEDEVYLLRNALTPPGTFSSGIAVQVIEPAELEAAPLEEFDLVMLCNVASPSAGVVGELTRFVRNGGGLFFSLGDEIGDPEQFNRTWHGDGAGIAPVAIDEPISPAGIAGGVGLRRDADHAITAAFPAEGDGLSEYVHFRRYFRVRESAPVHDAPRPTVLARYNDAEGSPALIESRAGAGRVVLFTSTIDADWNDWPRSIDGSFVVTMLETAQSLARRSDHPDAFLAGQQLVVPVLPDRYELSGVFKSPMPDDPDVEAKFGQRELLPGERVRLLGPAATRLGAYRIDLKARPGQTESRPISVNLAPTESHLAIATPGDVAAALAGLQYEWIHAGESFLAGDENARRELWHSVLAALVAVLVLEQSLAWWFGRQGRPVQRR